VPETITWEGAEALREMLVPVDDLAPFPGNPRRGDIEHIRASLRRFGQMKPLLVTSDGTIVAGHHVRLAAIEEGWSHVAVLPHEFADEGEARAYLLADNRLAELGGYERADLIQFLSELEASGRWGGSGYEVDDLERLRALEAEAEAFTVPPAPVEPVAAPGLREVVLLIDDEQQKNLSDQIRLLRREYGLDGVTETVLRALHEEARLLNQGDE
jgi:ParB-like chromosome segregation protein Spo0J